MVHSPTQITQNESRVIHEVQSHHLIHTQEDLLVIKKTAVQVKCVANLDCLTFRFECQLIVIIFQTTVLLLFTTVYHALIQ